ncbi:ROK family protein [Microbacterium excoecariae]|uniref:ROK family protein n=1 Tax=Microbacterium excoecariae TaxID=2715210 RepID=UPI00140D8946|nr:ROK family protein [Microbacterium excoecariae]NHI17606.1 ROK family protein [Microbacterium excoecariae]
MTAAPVPPRVGVDVGGTKILAVALGEHGRVVAEARRPTARGVAGVVDGVAHAIADLGLAAPPAAVGVGVPGQVRGGRVRQAVNLGIDDADLGALLAARLGAVVAVENDVNAAALGAAAFRGSGRSLAYLNLGTGVAAGLVEAGALVRGSRGAAGEVGHISIDPSGRACPCGQRGCIETLAGGGALAERWGGAGELPVRDLFDAADAGDPRAERIRSDAVRGTAAAIRALALAVDPDVVVIGGGVSRLGARLLDPVRRLLDDEARTSRFLAALDLATRFEVLAPGVPAGAVGAALAASGGRAEPAPAPVPSC